MKKKELYLTSFPVKHKNCITYYYYPGYPFIEDYFNPSVGNYLEEKIKQIDINYARYFGYENRCYFLKLEVTQYIKYFYFLRMVIKKFNPDIIYTDHLEMTEILKSIKVKASVVPLNKETIDDLKNMYLKNRIKTLFTVLLENKVVNHIFYVFKTLPSKEITHLNIFLNGTPLIYAHKNKEKFLESNNYIFWFDHISIKFFHKNNIPFKIIMPCSFNNVRIKKLMKKHNKSNHAKFLNNTFKKHYCNIVFFNTIKYFLDFPIKHIDIYVDNYNFNFQKMISFYCFEKKNVTTTMIIPSITSRLEEEDGLIPIDKFVGFTTLGNDYTTDPNFKDKYVLSRKYRGSINEMHYNYEKRRYKVTVVFDGMSFGSIAESSSLFFYKTIKMAKKIAKTLLKDEVMCCRLYPGIKKTQLEYVQNQLKNHDNIEISASTTAKNVFESAESILINSEIVVAHRSNMGIEALLCGCKLVIYEAKEALGREYNVYSEIVDNKIVFEPNNIEEVCDIVNNCSYEAIDVYKRIELILDRIKVIY